MNTQKWYFAILQILFNIVKFSIIFYGVIQFMYINNSTRTFKILNLS